jgi:hypothetical protein
VPTVPDRVRGEREETQCVRRDERPTHTCGLRLRDGDGRPRSSGTCERPPRERRATHQQPEEDGIGEQEGGLQRARLLEAPPGAVP